MLASCPDTEVWAWEVGMNSRLVPVGLIVNDWDQPVLGLETWAVHCLVDVANMQYVCGPVAVSDVYKKVTQKSVPRVVMLLCARITLVVNDRKKTTIIKYKYLMVQIYTFFLKKQ